MHWIPALPEAAHPLPRQLGLRLVFDLDWRRGQEPRLGPVDRGEEDLRPNHRREAPAPEKAGKLARQLAICEGSDWFWWFGDYNPADSVSDFDRLYRQQLRNLYEMLGEKAPPSLDRPISSGGGKAENSGTMRRGHE